jgi:hypothetical protein
MLSTTNKADEPLDPEMDKVELREWYFTSLRQTAYLRARLGTGDAA